MRLAGQRRIALHGPGKVLGNPLGAVRGPVRIGAQEQRIPGLLLLQVGEQVGGEDAVAVRRFVQLPIEPALLSARPLLAEVFRVQARLRRDDRQQQFHPVLVEPLLDAPDQPEVGLDMLHAVDHRLELFITEQPVVTAQHHPRAAFVEDAVVQCRP
ncbi:hypothetical protein D9M68_886670 [compost metagenome]